VASDDFHFDIKSNMVRTEKGRGPKEVRLPDWTFGSNGRRLFLEAVLLGQAPESGWSKSELEHLAAVERGGLDRLLAGAKAIGLVRYEGARWRPSEPLPPLATPLKELLEITRRLPDREIPTIAKRPYKKR
jgi:hypothetical protein